MFNKLDDCPGGDGTIDCVTMWHVLEHVHDLNETIESVKRVLNPEGIFLVAVPNSNSWDAQKYDKYWAAFDVPRHLYHFNAETMQKLVTNHGFKIRKIIPQKLDAFYVSLLSEKYKTGKSNYLKSLVFGFWSNYMAGKHEIGHSSQIFVLSMKKA